MRWLAERARWIFGATIIFLFNLAFIFAMVHSTHATLAGTLAIIALAPIVDAVVLFGGFLLVIE